MSMSNKNVLLIGSHANRKTGINYVLMRIAEVMQKAGYKVFYTSISGGETITPFLASKIPFTDSSRDPRRILETIRTVRPFLVISFDDIWHLEGVEYARQMYPFYWVHYLITEESNLHPFRMASTPQGVYKVDMRPTLTRCDKIIPCTEMAETVGKNWSLTNLSPVIRPPVPDDLFKFDKKARYKFRNENGYFDEDFIFVVVARNFIRKNIPFVIETFHHLQQNYKKAKSDCTPKLYLHVPRVPQVPIYGYDLEYLLSLYNRDDSIKISTTKEMVSFEEQEDETLNAMYSGGDCLLSLSNAEGIGYPPIEAMLTNMPILVGHGGYPKFFAKANADENLYVEAAGHFTPPGMNQVWFQYSVQQALDEMNQAIHKFMDKRPKKNRETILSYFEVNKFQQNWTSVAAEAQKRMTVGGVRI